MKKKYQENENCEECEDEDIDFSALLPLVMPGMNQQQDVLAENGVIFLTSVLTEKSTETVMHRLWAYHFTEDYTEPISLIINSPGGYAHCMWALIDTMNAIKNEIHTIALGELASAASMIFFAGDVRKISENTNVMIHNFAAAVEGKYPDLVATRKCHDLEYEKAIEHLLRHSKYTKKSDIKKYLLKDQDNWLSATELIDHGLCDVIYKNKKRKKK